MRYRRRSSPTFNDIKLNIVRDSLCILDISFIYYAWSLNEPAVMSSGIYSTSEQQMLTQVCVSTHDSWVYN